MVKLWGFHKFLCGVALLCGASLGVQGKEISADSLLFEQYKKRLCMISPDSSVQRVAVQAASLFKGTPYRSATLERYPQPEQLTVNLRALDCVTFVENVLALTQLVQMGQEKDFRAFKQKLQSIRYRKLPIEDYTSRIHYTTDWIRHNTNRKVFVNITPQLGGVVVNKQLSFISSNPQYYPALKADPSLRKKMQEIEKQLTQSTALCVIPTRQIEHIIHLLRDGDIVAFATNQPSLDYIHMGIVVKENNTTTFIHASSTHKKVLVEPYSLQDYCNRNARISGISVLRICSS